MGRKKKIEKEQLYIILRKLLPQFGYDRLTFSILAKELDVARSTIYEYFTNKDELIVNYMLYDMKTILAEWNKAKQHCTDDIEKIKQMIMLFHTYSAVHQGVKALPVVRKQANEELQQLLFELKTLHEQLFSDVIVTIENGISNGILNQSCDAVSVSQFIFYSIDMPKPPHITEQMWLAQLQQLILYGIRA